MASPIVFFTGSKIIGKQEIERILPHRKEKLLLDEVSITEERIIGKFNVTEEVCRGHAVLEGKEILKGSDLFDMAAQLLVVSWEAEHPNKGRMCLPRKYGGARFREVICPGDLLMLEIKIEDVKVETLGLKEGGEAIFLTGEKFLAKVDEKIHAEILGIYLAIL